MKEGLTLNKKTDKEKLKKINKSKKIENNVLKNIQKELGKDIEFTYGSKQDLKKLSRKMNEEVKNKTTKIKEDSKIFNLEKDTIVGIYQKSRNFGFVIPDDKKLGSDIYISKKNDLKAKDNQKVVVQITKLPKKDKSAEGKIIEIIGNINQAGVDMMSLIKEYNLPYEFPEPVMKEAKSLFMQMKKEGALDDALKTVDITMEEGEEADVKKAPFTADFPVRGGSCFLNKIRTKLNQ